MVCNAVAKFLLQQKKHKATLNTVASAIQTTWVAANRKGLDVKFKYLLKSTRGFVVQTIEGTDYVKLDTTQLFQLVEADAKKLLRLAAVLWPPTSPDPAVRIRYRMAERLVEQPNFKLPQGAIGQLGQIFGSAESLGISSYHAVLLDDPSGCFVFSSNTPRLICLDAGGLRRCAEVRQVSERVVLAGARLTFNALMQWLQACCDRCKL